MGVGLAFCISAAISYCAWKCRDHFGRYHPEKEAHRREKELQPMAGVYHITTTDFDPSVHISDYTPLHQRGHSAPSGYTGPGHPDEKRPTNRHKPAGSDSSMGIMFINMDATSSENAAIQMRFDDVTTAETSDLRPPRDRELGDHVTEMAVDTGQSGERLSSGSTASSESDEGICLDQECVDVSRKETDRDGLISVQ